MPTPLISIIVPVYKVEPYLRRCLDSIVNQTYTNLEIILVDDGSPDNCPQICDEYATKDKRIVVIHKENGGLSDARNAGLDICKGEYISFVDSDDWVDNRYVEFLLNKAQKENADIVIGAIEKVFDNGEKHADPFLKKTLWNHEESVQKIIFEPDLQWTVSWGKIYTRQLFSELRFPYGKIHEDERTSYLLVFKTKKICLVNTVLYSYYQRSDSIAQTDINYDRFPIVEEQFDFFIKNKRFDIANEIAVRLCWHWLEKQNQSKAIYWSRKIRVSEKRSILYRKIMVLFSNFPVIFSIYRKFFHA